MVPQFYQFAICAPGSPGNDQNTREETVRVDTEVAKEDARLIRMMIRKSVEIPIPIEGAVDAECANAVNNR